MRYLSIILLILLSACTTIEKSAKKPNIVLLLADDQTYTALSALGNPAISTPNLDQLVQNGTSFTHAYNMGGWNGAICVASRAMITSGQSLWNAQILHRNWRKVDSTQLAHTWGKLMENNGYDTYMSGKWHVPIPADQVFQRTAHIRPGMPRDYWQKNKTGRRFKTDVDAGRATIEEVLPLGYNRPINELDTSWLAYDTIHGGFWEGGLHWSEVLKNDALEFIHESQSKENPFFMYLAFNAPHDPRQAPKAFIDQYPLDKIALPKNWQANYPNLAEINGGQRLRDEALGPFPRTEFATKKHIQEYYAIITHLDEQIGKIIEALKQAGQMENTIIFFTADHGLAVGQHGMLGKQNMYDHSIRVPLVAMGNPFPEGKKVEADVYLQDVMASSLVLAGENNTDSLFFKPFLDLATGTSAVSHYPAIYGAYTNTQRMIRKEDYKLIVYPGLEQCLLFDLKKDPLEMQNLAQEPNYQDKLMLLFHDLIQLQAEMNDPLDLSVFYTQLKSKIRSSY